MDCSGLVSVTVENETPVSISSSTFSNRRQATLYVPYGSLDAYMDGFWMDFMEIVEMPDPASGIIFADANVKALCVSKWDTNCDGELSYNEAAAVTRIGNLFSCKDITSFDELGFFKGLTRIDGSSFALCSALSSITIPNSVTSIDERAFWGCSSLSSVIIPKSVNSISSYAFDGCSCLTNITIPHSVTKIDDLAFSGCSGLTTISVEPGNMQYDSRNDCNAIVETTTNRLVVGCKNSIILESITAIGDYAFFGCSGLTNITISNSVTSIGLFAFNECI